MAMAHTATLLALVDRIVPRDEFPSASEAGVIDFLDRLIEDEGLQALYAAGLAGLAGESQARFGRDFEQLSEDEQDALLTHLQTGDVVGEWGTDPARFFETVVRQTIEGYYADPGNGGNRGSVAWEMVGFRVTA